MPTRMPTKHKTGGTFLPSFGAAEPYKINLLCVAMAKEAKETKERSSAAPIVGIFMLQTLSMYVQLYIEESISYHE
jgi:hypothetical protein